MGNMICRLNDVFKVRAVVGKGLAAYDFEGKVVLTCEDLNNLDILNEICEKLEEENFTRIKELHIEYLGSEF